MVVLMTGSPPGASATVLHTWEWSPQHNRKQAEDQRKMFREQAEQRKERQRAKSVSPQAGASHTGSPNGSPEIGRAICLDKLVIRKGHELESDRVGNLLEGTPVLVLEEQTLRDGTVRSRVGKESSPRGVVVDTIGWITSVKEGKGKLRPLTDADQTAIGSARRSPKRREAQVRADSPAPTWLTTSELSERAQAQWTAASSLEARVFDTVEERLGYLLVAMDRSEEEMLLEFDANNDGEISRVEFRDLVRGLGSSEQRTHYMSQLLQAPTCPDEQIDAVFRALDIDNSGGLEVRELNIAFAKLKGALKRKKYLDTAAKVDGARTAAAALDEAAKLVGLSDVEEEQLVAFRRQNGSPASRLGELLKEKGVKVSDLKAKWDKDGNGKLDRTEFDKNIRELGFAASDGELAELFVALDHDNSRSLASKELIAALKKLQSDAANKTTREGELVRNAMQARKTAESGLQKALRLEAAA